MPKHADTNYPTAPNYARNPETNYTYHAHAAGYLWTIRSKGHGKAKRWLAYVPRTSHIQAAKQLHELVGKLSVLHQNAQSVRAIGIN